VAVYLLEIYIKRARRRRDTRIYITFLNETFMTHYTVIGKGICKKKGWSTDIQPSKHQESVHYDTLGLAKKRK
jgi:hypothetical protein